MGIHTNGRNYTGFDLPNLFQRCQKVWMEMYYDQAEYKRRYIQHTRNQENEALVKNG